MDPDERHDRYAAELARDVGWRNPRWLDETRAWLVEEIAEGRVRATPQVQARARALLKKRIGATSVPTTDLTLPESR
jgi:hypothetical protein